MLDTVIKVIAIAGFILSLAVIVTWVPEWNLILVMLLATAMAVYDFFLRPRRKRNGD